MSKITTGQMYSQWEQMNQKLEALDNKIDGIIDGTTPANTQVTGSNVVKEWKGLTDLIGTGGVRRYGATNSPLTPLDFTNMSSTYVRVRNGHNVSITFFLQITGKDNTSVYYQPIDNQVMPAGATKVWYLDKEPTIGVIAQTYTSPSVAPTTGNMDILIIGQGG